MAHFAKIENGIVTQVIVIDQETLNTGNWGDPASWIQTSYNTQGGQHRLGGTQLRKNYAGIGYTYDSVRDAFIPPKPYSSWLLDEDSCLWKAPTPMPIDGKSYVWDEATNAWIEFVAFMSPETTSQESVADEVETPVVTPETTSQESVADEVETPVVTPETTSPAQE